MEALPQSDTVGHCSPSTLANCGGSIKSVSYIWSFNNDSGVSGDLASPGVDKTLRFLSCPAGLGVGGFVYISGDKGTAEAALITGISCTATMPGTITIFTAEAHVGAWSASTSTAGIQEAITSMSLTGGTVVVPSGTFTVHSRITVFSNIVLQGAGLEHTTIFVPRDEFIDAPPWQFGLTPSATVVFAPPGSSHIGIAGLSITFDSQASPPNGSYGIIFVDTRNSTINGVAVRNGPILKDGNTFLPVGVLGLSADNRVQDSFVYNQICATSSEGAGGFIADGKSNSFVRNYVSNGCNSSYVTIGEDTLFEGNVFDLADSTMVADAQAFASDNGSGARFVNNTCNGNGNAPACFTTVTDASSPDTLNSSFVGNIARHCSEGYQFQSTLARSRGVIVKGGSVTDCGVPVSIVGIVDSLLIDGVQRVRSVHSNRVYAITATDGANSDIETADADAVWFSGASGDFSVGGFKGGWNGRKLEIVNATAHEMALTTNDPDATRDNRICIPGEAEVRVTNRGGFAILTYSSTGACWVASNYERTHH
jgi:hypothetical protein